MQAGEGDVADVKAASGARTTFLAFSTPGAPDVVALLNLMGSATATSGWLRQLREKDKKCYEVAFSACSSLPCPPLT